MPDKKASAYYRKVDVQNFTHYITLAFFVGAIPNLVDDISPWLLGAAAVVAAVTAGIIWVRSKRKDGIGVYFQIPKRNSTSNPLETFDENIKKEMNKKHRDWFRFGPPIRANTVEERVDWSLQTIRYRLDETEQRDGSEPHLFLYFYLPLQESFVLGTNFSMPREADGRKCTPTIERYTLGDHIKPRIRSLTRFPGNPYMYEIDLSTMMAPNVENRTTENPIQLHQSISLTGNGQKNDTLPHRMALIIHADPNNSKTFVEEAMRAASGMAGHRYRTNRNDRCDHALVLGISTDVLYNALDSSTPKSPEPIIDNIRSTCIEEIEHIYNESDVPVRVFMLGPSILAFAMGALLPAGARLVAHDSTYPLPERTGTEIRQVVAIIDGDDVGASSERFLLSGDLETASTYSSWVTKTLEAIIDDINMLPGVELHSAGGDSAIFVLPSDSLNAFLRRLDQLRAEFSFNVSCGYGFGTFEAYNALRLAKTSGKNISTGSMHTAAAEPN